MAEDVFGVVGSVIAGMYRVEHAIAAGRFGALYRAHHAGLGVRVALELLSVPSQEPREQAAFVQLFRSEAGLWQRLATTLPAMVRPLHVDAFTSKEGLLVPYIVLEWLDGITLEALISQRSDAQLPPIALRKLCRLLTPVARALERAHRFVRPDGMLGLSHCHLEPANLFITRAAGEEVVKLLGFALGTVTPCTPAYAAPEQWAPEQYGEPGPRTDVWGLALCLVEAMLGRRVLDGELATMRARALDAKLRPTPRSAGIDVSDSVEAVFTRALALEPAARPRDLGVFWDELMAALDDAEESRPASEREHSSAMSHFVPDLELTPQPISRRPSGELAAQPQGTFADLLELDSPAMSASSQLELDLPPESLPQRSASYPRLLAVQPALSAPPPAAVRTSQPPPRTPSNSPVSSRVASPPPESPRGSTSSSNPALSARLSSRPLSANGGDPLETGFVAKLTTQAPETRGLAQRVRLALGLLAAAILLAVCDPLYAATAGKVLEIGGMRLSWLSGALLLAAVFSGVRELLREE